MSDDLRSASIQDTSFSLTTVPKIRLIATNALLSKYCSSARRKSLAGSHSSAFARPGTRSNGILTVPDFIIESTFTLVNPASTATSFWLFRPFSLSMRPSMNFAIAEFAFGRPEDIFMFISRSLLHKINRLLCIARLQRGYSLSRNLSEIFTRSIYHSLLPTHLGCSPLRIKSIVPGNRADPRQLPYGGIQSRRACAPRSGPRSSSRQQSRKQRAPAPLAR